MKLEDLKHIMSQYFNSFVMPFHYEKWSDDTRLRDSKETMNSLETFPDDKKIDFNELSKDELSSLGFKLWADDSKIMLMPLVMFYFCKTGTQLITISGKKKIIGKDDINTDVRYGCLAYGVIPRDS